jgi:hypothetical protein
MKLSHFFTSKIGVVFFTLFWAQLVSEAYKVFKISLKGLSSEN